MGIDMLFFDYRKPEESFFEKYDYGCYHISFFQESLNTLMLKKIPEEALENVTVISVFIDSVVDEDVLKHFKNLRVVATRSTGYDHIDIDYCRKHHIAVFNVDNYGSTTVAQYTLGLIIALTRRIVGAFDYMRDDKKTEYFFLGRNLDALTLGVIGTGAIGGSVCDLANCFGMEILAYDPLPKKEIVKKCGVKYVSLDELFENSDVITLHAPYTKENYHLLSRPQFEKMKKKPYIINTSRGELINLSDLKNALKREQIAGAALDVLTCESLTFRCQENCPMFGSTNPECIDELKLVADLVKMENVIITPHVAYETQEAINLILNTSMNSIRDYFKGASTYRVV